MKVIVDELPKRPNDCLFAKENREYIEGFSSQYKCSFSGYGCCVKKCKRLEVMPVLKSKDKEG